MQLKQPFFIKPAVIVLMALMAATRFDHFGSAVVLPDASLAVFFLAGLWLGGRYLFAALLLEAGLVDYVAINQLGVSDYCISSAYLFLIAAYAAMWLAGKWCRAFSAVSVRNLVRQFSALIISTSVAFTISNGSFYLLSDKVAETSWAHYVQHFATYYPSYLMPTVLYVVVIFAGVTIVKALRTIKTAQQTF